MSSTVQRIGQYIDFKGIKVSVFEKKIGMSNASFGKSLKNNKSIGVDKLENILNEYTELNPVWLLTGKGEMLLSEEHLTEIKRGIPLIPTQAMAGLSSGSVSIREQDIQQYYNVPDFTNVDFMIRIKGSSMYPKYNSGDVVACRMINDSKFLQWNKVHVIATKEQGVLIKRLKKGGDDTCLLAVSDNESYDPFEIPKDEILNIALVVGVIRQE